MEDLDNPMEELRRRMQKLFNEKEKEYLYKLSEVNLVSLFFVISGFLGGEE